jgi:hypothetical protein
MANSSSEIETGVAEADRETCGRLAKDTHCSDCKALLQTRDWPVRYKTLQQLIDSANSCNVCRLFREALFYQIERRVDRIPSTCLDESSVMLTCSDKNYVKRIIVALETKSKIWSWISKPHLPNVLSVSFDVVCERSRGAFITGVIKAWKLTDTRLNLRSSLLEPSSTHCALFQNDDDFEMATAVRIMSSQVQHGRNTRGDKACSLHRDSNDPGSNAHTPSGYRQNTRSSRSLCRTESLLEWCSS